MMFTQFSILNPHSRDVDENRSPFVRQRTERIEHVLGLSTDLHHLSLSSFENG